MENCVTVMSKRKLTREFKEAAVRQLDLGASTAEVARACEVTRAICTAGGWSCGSLGPMLSPGQGGAAARRTASPRWSAK